MNDKKGFTLTELLAVIAIMAVLSIAAISGYTTMTKNSKKKTYETKVSEIENAAIKFAKETNLTTSKTISVNKLVVFGFIQPDEATDSGLSVISNPVTNENMICNLISITIDNDVYVAQYYENKKDCEIAEKDQSDSEITIMAYSWTGGTINRSTENELLHGDTTADWTKEDVVLIVSSSRYTDFVSISYDYNGNTIIKEKNNPVSDSEYREEDCNKLAIRNVAIMFNSEVTVTYNMADGSTYSKTVVIRIDREAPTARLSVDNDVTKESTKKVSAYLDDANGSGIKRFHISKNQSFTDSIIIDKNNSSNSTSVGKGKLNGYNSHFYGEKGTYYFKVEDKVGNFSETKHIDLSNFDSERNSCSLSVSDLNTSASLSSTAEWFNKSIKITGTSNNNIGNPGVKYYIGPNSGVPVENQLKKSFVPTSTNTILRDSANQTSETDLIDYYMAMMGLSTPNVEIAYCKKTVGVDFVRPTVSVACTNNDCDTYKQTHSLTITLQDDRSGFFSSAGSIKIGWSASNTSAPTQWKDITGGTISNYTKSGKTIKDGKVTITTTNNGYTSTTPLTGTYYLWIKGDSFTDKAGNQAVDTPSSFSIKYDNTPPTCTNSGGSSNWTNSNVTLRGSCSDSHSGCVTHSNSGDYTYASNGTVSRTYTSEINSTTESPGVIYDAAGNHTSCTANQTVRIDKTKPTCDEKVKNDAGQVLGYKDSRGNHVLQHVPVTTYAGCNDSLSGCKASEVKGNRYDTTIALNLTLIGEDYTRIDDIYIEDNAGNQQKCRVKAYTIPHCRYYEKVAAGKREVNGYPFWCTLRFYSKGPLNDPGRNLYTSFCIGFNDPNFKKTYGTPRYFGICEGGDGSGQCKAFCKGNPPYECKTYYTLAEAFHNALSFPNAGHWTTYDDDDGKYYYFQRFEKIRDSNGNVTNKNYPFSGRMMSKVSDKKYNICDIDLDANGNEILERK